MVRHRWSLGLITLLLAPVSLASVRLDRAVVGCGGGVSGGAGHAITATLGQAAAGQASNDNHLLHIGFWYPGLGHVVFVPDGLAPAVLALEQNYPNPFNPTTIIGFSVPESAPIRLAIHDIRGRQVRLLVDEVRPAGRQAVTWTGDDDLGRPLASGTYLVSLVAPSGAQTRKLVLAR